MKDTSLRASLWIEGKKEMRHTLKKTKVNQMKREKEEAKVEEILMTLEKMMKTMRDSTGVKRKMKKNLNRLS